MDILNFVLALMGTGIISAALVYAIKTNLDRKRCPFSPRGPLWYKRIREV